MDRRSGSSSAFRPRQNQANPLVFVVGGIFLLVGVAIMLVPQSNDQEGSGEETRPPVVIEQPPEIEMVDVLVPVQPIEAGTEFMPDMFKVEQKPRISLPSGVVSSFVQIQGQFAKSRIMMDQPVTSKLITSVRPTIPIDIPPGFRAVTIPVDETTGVEGWAKPGVRVDVSWTTLRQGRNVVVTIVNNAKVLSAGGNPSSNPNEPAGMVRTVTLLVTEEDANRVQLAKTNGKLSLSLRGGEDPGARTQFVITSEDDFFGVSKNEPEARKKLGCVRVKRPGDGYDEMCLNDDGNLEPVE
jgi:pilus assembly protein CpaB